MALPNSTACDLNSRKSSLLRLLSAHLLLRFTVLRPYCDALVGLQHPRRWPARCSSNSFRKSAVLQMGHLSGSGDPGIHPRLRARCQRRFQGPGQEPAQTAHSRAMKTPITAAHTKLTHPNPPTSQPPHLHESPCCHGLWLHNRDPNQTTKYPKEDLGVILQAMLYKHFMIGI